MKPGSTCSATTSRLERAAISRNQSGRSLPGAQSSKVKKPHQKGMTVNSPYIHPIVVPPVKSCPNGQDKIFLTTKQLLEATAVPNPKCNKSTIRKPCPPPRPLQAPPASVAQYQLRKRLLQDNLEIVQSLSMLKHQSQSSAAENWDLVYRNRAFLANIFGNDWNTQLRMPKQSQEQLWKDRHSIARTNHNFAENPIEKHADNSAKNMKPQVPKPIGPNVAKVKFGHTVTINRENAQKHSRDQRCQSTYANKGSKICSRYSRNRNGAKRKQQSATNILPTEEKSMQQIKSWMVKTGADINRKGLRSHLPPVMKGSILAMTFDLLSGENRDALAVGIPPKSMATVSTPFEDSTVTSNSASVAVFINKLNKQMPLFGKKAVRRSSPKVQLGKGSVSSTNGNYMIQSDKAEREEMPSLASPSSDIEIKLHETELQFNSTEDAIEPKKLAELAAKKILFEQSKKIHMLLRLNATGKFPGLKDSFTGHTSVCTSKSNADEGGTPENASTSMERSNTYWDVKNVTRWVENLSPTTGSSIDRSTVLSSGVSSGSSLPSEYPGHTVSESEALLIKSLNNIESEPDHSRLVGTSTESLLRSLSSIKLKPKSPQLPLSISSLCSSENSKYSSKPNLPQSEFPLSFEKWKSDRESERSIQDSVTVSTSLKALPDDDHSAAEDIPNNNKLPQGPCETGTSCCNFSLPTSSLVSITSVCWGETFVFDDDNYFKNSTGTTPICRSLTLRVPGQQLLNDPETETEAKSRRAPPKLRRRYTEIHLQTKKGKQLFPALGCSPQDSDLLSGGKQEPTITDRGTNNKGGSKSKARKKAGRRVSFSDPIALWTSIPEPVPEKSFDESKEVMLQMDEILRRHIYFRYPQQSYSDMRECS